MRITLSRERSYKNLANYLGLSDGDSSTTCSVEWSVAKDTALSPGPLTGRLHARHGSGSWAVCWGYRSSSGAETAPLVLRGARRPEGVPPALDACAP
ncbi:hypothetical protein NDU88_004032 [Pleurodeles waltl]|uniref:Uncharacterized protein n=1 Tax=Pleurodeles waltl TaxID=8319 RepID=A0AAV7M552_PLEWA|nr:hypothetical protein NDU88_004032 [Pleurodeles waltl]